MSFYYDVETDHQYAPYATLNLVGILWEDDREEIFQAPFSNRDQEYLQELFASEEEKIGFNNCNFDDLVLYNHGFSVNETNRHDGFLAAKTLYPELPAFSLKFLNWWFFGDYHMPEYHLESNQLLKGAGSKFIGADDKLLKIYNRHDLFQHKNLWKKCLEDGILTDENHRRAYLLDLSNGKPLEEMIFKGGLYVDRPRTEYLIQNLEKAMARNSFRVEIITKGRVQNANSNKQLGKYFDEEGIELELTEKGAFKVDKELLEDLWRLHPVAKCVRNVRKINAQLKYYKNYIRALDDKSFHASKGENYIPVSFSISGARTRRYTSSSKYGLNFQNSSDVAKKVLIVPPGWIAWWLDETQIENVVHIYESNDIARRKAYEADPEWSEYVWLCNKILGRNLSKKELDSIQSKVNPLWSVYKQYKTVKLMMNFGAGVRKFASVTGFPEREARGLFEDIHKACPAIKQLQNLIEEKIRRYGEVYDVFGHVYRGSPETAYKIVAYLIQGCGTGSLNKAQIRANWETGQKYNQKYGEDVALLSCTTHDEIGGYIHLERIGEKETENILTELKFNMTERFSPLFDNIPLRSKLYLSTTNAIKRKEVKSLEDYLGRSPEDNARIVTGRNAKEPIVRTTSRLETPATNLPRNRRFAFNNVGY